MPERTLTSFVYHGPTSGVTLRLEDGTSIDVMLFDGKTVELPAEHPHVVRLIARKHLGPASAATVVLPTVIEPPAATITTTTSSRGRKGRSADTDTISQENS